MAEGIPQTGRLDKGKDPGYGVGVPGKRQVGSSSARRRRRRGRLSERARPVVAVADLQQALTVSPGRLRRLVKFVARQEGQRLAQVDLAIVSSREMAGLNRRYLHRRRATDVLSFDLSEAGACGLVVQIVVCGDLARAQGRFHGHSGEEELLVYVIHGLLHQMGYEDASVRGAARMHAREDQILAKFLKTDRRG
jgi:probable rRNA maturation factor